MDARLVIAGIGLAFQQAVYLVIMIDLYSCIRYRKRARTLAGNITVVVGREVCGAPYPIWLDIPQVFGKQQGIAGAEPAAFVITVNRLIALCSQL